MSRISLSVVRGYTPTQNAARPESATSPYRYLPRSTPSTSENRRRSRLPLMSMTLLVRGDRAEDSRGGFEVASAIVRRRGPGFPDRDRTPVASAVPAGGLRGPARDVLRSRAHALVPGPEHTRRYPCLARAADRAISRSGVRIADRGGSGDGGVPRERWTRLDAAGRRRACRDRLAHQARPQGRGDRARGGGGGA